MAPATKFEPVDLVSPKRGLTMILTPDRKIRNSVGDVVETERGETLKFRDGRATVDNPRTWAMVQEHSVFTGGQEPKLCFLLSDSSQMPQPAEGVRIVTGAVSSKTGSRAAEPCPGYDAMQHAALRKAVQDGRIEDLAGAISYERSFRGRRGVIELFAAAIVAKALPSEKAMAASDEKALEELKEEPIDTANPGDSGTEPETTEQIAAALAAREAIDEAIDPEHSEPIPGEGVV